MKENIRFLIVGCGSIGIRHLQNLRSLGLEQIVAVDRDESRLNDAIESGATETFVDLEEALAASDPDAGLVCVPNQVHVSVALKLAEAGLDLFIEKPLSHNYEKIPELLDIANQRDLVTLVGCNLRFHPGIELFRDIVQKTDIGSRTAVQVETGSYLPEWHPDEDYRQLYSADADMGGGAVLDCIHEINYARWIFGDIAIVSGMMGQNSSLEIDTEDSAGMIVEFESGIIGELHVDYIQREYTRSCKLIGDDGAIRWDWAKDTVDVYDPEADDWISYDVPSWEPNDMYLKEMRHFLNAVQSRDTTTCELQEGAADLRIALAAKQSAANERHISPSEIETMVNHS